MSDVEEFLQTPGAVLGRRARDDEGGDDRNVQARRTVSINVGDCEFDEEGTRDGFASRSLFNRILPVGAKITMERAYEGEKMNIGQVIIIVGKQQKHLKHMCLYTSPPSIGKIVISKLEKKNGKQNMKQRHPGIEWVGIDESNLCARCDVLKKCGWFANTGTCGGSKNLYNMIKKLAREVLTSGIGVDFKLAEIQLTAAKLKTATQIMNILIGQSGDSSGSEAEEET